MARARTALLGALTAVVLCSSATCGGGASSDRQTAPPDVPEMSVRSDDVTDGQPLPQAQLSAGLGGADESPQVSWAGFPDTTKSFAVTVFDPDAGGDGYWHWAVIDLAPDITSLPAGAGAPDGSQLPAGAVALRNSAGQPGYVGAAPPQGSGTHHYEITVTALDVATLTTDNGASAAAAADRIRAHAIARGQLVGTAER